MRKKTLIGSAVVTLALVIVALALLAQSPSTLVKSHAPEELPTEETLPNLLVIPEVPLGTLAIVLACLSALLISQMKPKARLR